MLDHRFTQTTSAVIDPELDIRFVLVLLSTGQVERVVDAPRRDSTKRWTREGVALFCPARSVGPTETESLRITVAVTVRDADVDKHALRIPGNTRHRRTV